jgi:hypothetical protein
MRKVVAQLNAEERVALLYLADLGTAVFASALATCVLKLVGDLL